jgi:hypothetical protein
MSACLTCWLEGSGLHAKLLHMLCPRGQGARDSAAAASAAEALRREQLAVKQSKQLVPMIALSPGAGKAKLKPGPPGSAAGGSTTNAVAGGGQVSKTIVHLNGSTVTRKASLDALARLGSQTLSGQDGAPSTLVELGTLPDRPASAAASLAARGASSSAASVGVAPRSPGGRHGELHEAAASSMIAVQAMVFFHS